MHNRLRGLTALLATTLIVGGCSDVNTTNPDRVDNPLSDADTRSQVIDPLKALVRSMKLDVVLASFAFESCNDQNEAPFRGRSNANVAPPAGTAPDTFRQSIHDELIAAQGWESGPPAGKTLFGLTAHKGALMATLTVNDEQTTIPGTVSIDVIGECRDTANHAGAPRQTITSELAPDE